MKDTHESLQLTKRGRIVAGTAAGALVLGAALGLAIHEKHESDKSTATKQVEALKNVHSILNNVVMLKSGAILRSTPETLNGTPDNGEPNNIEQTVPKDKVLVVRLAGMDEEHHPGWIAFAEPDADVSTFTSLKDRAKHTVWANYASLMEQGMVIETAYQPVSADPVLRFSTNPLAKTPNHGRYATSMEANEKQAGIAQFILTGDLNK